MFGRGFFLLPTSGQTVGTCAVTMFTVQDAATGKKSINSLCAKCETAHELINKLYQNQLKGQLGLGEEKYSFKAFLKDCVTWFYSFYMSWMTFSKVPK